jgi:hypothetical protein
MFPCGNRIAALLLAGDVVWHESNGETGRKISRFPD